MLLLGSAATSRRVSRQKVSRKNVDDRGSHLGSNKVLVNFFWFTFAVYGFLKSFLTDCTDE